MDLPPNVKNDAFTCSVFFVARRRHSLGMNIGRQNHLMHKTMYSPKRNKLFSQGSGFLRFEKETTES